MSLVTLPRAQIPLTLNGNAISSEWYRWAHDVTIRAGGVTGSSTDELTLMQFEDAGIEEMRLDVFSLRDEMRQAPPVVVMPADDQLVTSDLQARVDKLEGDLNSLAQRIEL